MLAPLDLIVIVAYLLGVAGLGIWAGGKQTSKQDYFLGNRNLPWWAVCFSVVATETSTLTVISVPGIAYLGTLTFLQLTIGYLLGRIIVAYVLLPKYFAGDLSTAYQYLGQRFGRGMQASASATFLLTRLLADGVRLFATAIPLKIIADAYGMPIDYWQIIVGIGLITIAYTYIGGIKAVVWMDVVQMLLYIGGAIVAIVLLLGDLPEGWYDRAVAAGKTQIFDVSGNPLTKPYFFLTAVIGGGLLSMASHGADQLIVQRLLTCRNLGDSRKALIGSGVVVMIQFALFLAVGLLLWAFYGGQDLAAIGLTRGDEIFPRFIVEEMPVGVSGLLLAGIVAAAMSTLSSSLNALASSTMQDLYERFARTPLDDARSLKLARLFTLFWGIVFIGFANLFQSTENPVVELGLGIAGYTYGGLLGAFLLGLLNRRVQQTDAIIAFFVAVALMTLVIFGTSVAWPWYTAIGTAVTVGVGSLLALRHGTGGNPSPV